MKIIRTRHLEKAIVPFELWEKILGYDLKPEDALPKEIYAIDGEMARTEMKKLGVDCKCKEHLSESCLYVFRKTLNTDRIVPYRVTMHPKTAANYYRGSKNYGELKILKDTFQ